MRKKRIEASVQNPVSVDQQWLDLESLTQVEFTSEQIANPIENAFSPDTDSTWRAANPGKQTIRLLFDHPQNSECIRLLFREETQARTQEFLLRYSADGGISYQEILRQQYTFSPPDTCLQVEEYRVQLQGITAMELTIIPDINGGGAHASMVQWQIA
ncbi:hypothetical protein Q0590_30530 [Rhodocytophaga aerolata]|uniref:Discoidin domain-containing protein n=1 Tax=Rhodocytophaga aerolata TaxID=455078 RepID=A0ABT8RF90_9BACT|nr:hypothetical protein [Rhodocytophaga aerolata]MDO1450649.1 hypothetical protein [Rhodocytophaga aerolata]